VPGRSAPNQPGQRARARTAPGREPTSSPSPMESAAGWRCEASQRLVDALAAAAKRNVASPGFLPRRADRRESTRSCTKRRSIGPGPADHPGRSRRPGWQLLGSPRWRFTRLPLPRFSATPAHGGPRVGGRAGPLRRSHRGRSRRKPTPQYHHRCVGIEPSVESRPSSLRTLRPGDTFLLSSDGLHGLVTDDELAGALIETVL